MIHKDLLKYIDGLKGREYEIACAEAAALRDWMKYMHISSSRIKHTRRQQTEDVPSIVDGKKRKTGAEMRNTRKGIVFDGLHDMLMN